MASEKKRKKKKKTARQGAPKVETLH